ncbi:gas vesicle protein GvpJ [Glycomyces sp. NPDC049804]|uniref:gas vesicle protein GvpJ n=1 Tax=Glycomyces sp. NPDC049804 TaxID=3154363 RepID=UPI00343E9AD1
MTGREQSALSPQYGGSVTGPGGQSTNLGDILERVLDRGLVIVGDIRISLLDIELLTIKLRLLVASVDTARQLGIDWWEHDPWLTSRARQELEAGSERDEIASSPDAEAVIGDDDEEEADERSDEEQEEA